VPVIVQQDAQQIASLCAQIFSLNYVSIAFMDEVQIDSDTILQIENTKLRPISYSLHCLVDDGSMKLECICTAIFEFHIPYL
jgi:hypothetical protein